VCAASSAVSGSTVRLQICTEADLDELAVLNKQLIEDEGHDNKMNIAELRERMRGFIAGTYCAYLFKAGGKTVGYALVDRARKPCYLRQFMICRDTRRMGYGTAAFKALLQTPGTTTIDIEALVWNASGVAFWHALGFKDRSIYMRYDVAEAPVLKA